MDYDQMKEEMKESAYRTAKNVTDFAEEKINQAIDSARKPKEERKKYVNTSYRPVGPLDSRRSSDKYITDPPARQDPPPLTRAVRKRSKIPLFLTLILGLMGLLVFSLQSWWQFVVYGLLCAAVFGLLSVIFKGKTVYVPIKAGKEHEKIEENVKADNSVPTRCGIPEVDKLLFEGYRCIDDMNLLNDAIEDEEVSRQIDRMTVAGGKIFTLVEKQPDKAPQIRKFMNYYLPTTIKLLNSYYRLDKQGIKGENISGTMLEIEGMLSTIAGAFEKQLDALFRDEAMDISSDISVMESMLKQENLL